MSFWKKAKKGLGGGLLAGVTGGASLLGGSHALDQITGAAGRRQARADLERGIGEADTAIRGGYPTAQQQVTDAGTGAETALTGGFSRARGDASGGFSRARASSAEGFNAAKGRYDAPEIVTSRQELYRRAKGEGGFTPEQLDMMKGGARDEYGTAMREGIRNINQYTGDSSSSGRAGERFGRFAADIGGRRANAVRDIDVANANRVRDEQASAIGSLYNEANQRAGIDIAGGNAMAGLDRDEAALLSNLSTGEASALAQIKSATGLNLAQLTTEEARLLASIATGGGAQIASTRDTAGLMPLIGSFVQGAGQGLGASVGRG